MFFAKLRSTRVLTIVAGIVLLLGVALAVGGLRQPTNTQSKAAGSCGDSTAPTGKIISQGKSASASNTYLDNSPSKVVDGEINIPNHWNAGNYAPQWIEINLGSKQTITGLKLYVQQNPNGQTTHQILAGDNPAPTTVVKTISCDTQQSQVINVVFSTPLTNVQYIRLNTTVSPSWVAWQEIQVFAPDPTQTMTCSFYSDTSNTVTGGGNAVATYKYPDWTASIPGATWIWSAAKVENPKVDMTKTFNKNFYLTLPVNSASVTISADNTYSVTVNNEEHYSGQDNWVTPATHTFATSRNFKDGLNTLSTTVKNFGLDTTPELNPAGVLYKFTVTAKYCGENPPSGSGGTKVSLDLLLHGIGKAGDSVLPGEAGGGNTDPKRKIREATVSIYKTGTAPIMTKKGNVEYKSDSGSFKGAIDIGDLAAGQYIVKVKLPQSLLTQVGNLQTIKSGETNTMPQTSLVTGDINNDGLVTLDVRDYNIFLGCYSTILPAASCTEEQKVQADLDDNEKVDDFDFNLFIRELSHNQGQN